MAKRGEQNHGQSHLIQTPIGRTLNLLGSEDSRRRQSLVSFLALLKVDSARLFQWLASEDGFWVRNTWYGDEKVLRIWCWARFQMLGELCTRLAQRPRRQKLYHTVPLLAREIQSLNRLFDAPYSHVNENSIRMPSGFRIHAMIRSAVAEAAESDMKTNSRKR